jgi:hypothetical protein
MHLDPPLTINVNIRFWERNGRTTVAAAVNHCAVAEIQRLSCFVEAPVAVDQQA